MKKKNTVIQTGVAYCLLTFLHMLTRSKTPIYAFIVQVVALALALRATWHYYGGIRNASFTKEVRHYATFQGFLWITIATLSAAQVALDLKHLAN